MYFQPFQPFLAIYSHVQQFTAIPATYSHLPEVIDILDIPTIYCNVQLRHAISSQFKPFLGD